MTTIHDAIGTVARTPAKHRARVALVLIKAQLLEAAAGVLTPELLTMAAVVDEALRPGRGREIDDADREGDETTPAPVEASEIDAANAAHGPWQHDCHTCGDGVIVDASRRCVNCGALATRTPRRREGAVACPRRCFCCFARCAGDHTDGGCHVALDGHFMAFENLTEEEHAAAIALVRKRRGAALAKVLGE